MTDVYIINYIHRKPVGNVAMQTKTAAHLTSNLYHIFRCCVPYIA